MSRIEQVNELIKSQLAKLVNQEVVIEGCLITISYIDCSLDLKNAKIGVSVLPEKFSGSALSALRKNSSRFSNSIKKKTKLRHIPRFRWLIDTTEKKAWEIEELFKKIKEEERKDHVKNRPASG
ncbi:MAG: ribosome-binding factor A [Patescibacteria group bacterium]